MSLTSTKPDRVFNQPAFNLRMQSRHALVIERNLAAHQNVENNAKTPYIDFGASVYFCVEEFGCCEIEGSTEGGEVSHGVEEVGQSKVNYFDVAGLGNEYVFNLQI